MPSAVMSAVAVVALVLTTDSLIYRYPVGREAMTPHAWALPHLMLNRPLQSSAVRTQLLKTDTISD
jgi:hypothetical protein